MNVRTPLLKYRSRHGIHVRRSLLVNSPSISRAVFALISTSFFPRVAVAPPPGGDTRSRRLGLCWAAKRPICSMENDGGVFQARKFEPLQQGRNTIRMGQLPASLSSLSIASGPSRASCSAVCCPVCRACCPPRFRNCLAVELTREPGGERSSSFALVQFGWEERRRIEGPARFEGLIVGKRTRGA